MSKVIALIPARGGSKGIKQKNVAPLLGKPLIDYSIAAARSSGVIDEVYVSSDDELILSVALSLGAKTIRRSPALALDESPTDPLIAEFIAHENLSASDIIVLLQPTSPLRMPHHIIDSLQRFRAHPSCRSLISVYEVNNKYLKAYIAGGEFLTPLAGTNTSYSRRQDLPSVVMPNGALYIFTVAEFLREQKIPRSQIISYVMSEAESLDIDTPGDLAAAEQALQQRQVSNE
jgi:CMP-N,N'-diacetyllegionaminic acid synthase